MSAKDSLNAASAARWKPPPSPRSIYQTAKTMRLPDGPQAGETWNPDLEPAQREWLLLWDSGRFNWFLLIAPRQRGKTVMGIICPIIWSVVERQQSVGYIMPNLDKLAQNYGSKFKPGFEGSGYGSWFPTKGPGSKQGRPPAIAMRRPETGRIAAWVYFMALGRGGSESSTSSVSPALTVLDEGDDAESPGQLINALGRSDGWGSDGRAVITSTVNHRGGRTGHPVLQLYPEGTRTRFHHKCPHCQTLAPLEFENIDIDAGCVKCPVCTKPWTERERRDAIAGGSFVHGTMEPRRPRFASILLWELDFLRGIGVSGIINEYRSAIEAKNNGDFSLWRVFVNKRLCREVSESDSDVPVTVDMTLAARAMHKALPRGEKPPESQVITIGSDTGKREVWWLALSMSQDLSWHVLDWSVKTTGDHRAEPSQQDQTDMLDRMHERALRIGRADSMGMDVGYNTDLVEKWTKRNGYLCLRGDQRPNGKKEEHHNRKLPSWAENRKQDNGMRWLFLNGAEIKKEIHKALAREPGTPGAGHIPLGQEAGDWLIKHITAESWDSKHEVWVKRPGRDNHLLDCLVYAWAQAVIALNRPRFETPSDPPAPSPPSSWLGDSSNWIGDNGGEPWIN